MSERIYGRILKGIGGFYYVEAEQTVYECKARGLFRKNGAVPAAGDMVYFSLTGETTGNIEEICERKNSLIRPLVANVDMLIIVAAAKNPDPNLFLIDKLTVIARYNNMEPVIVFNKIDLVEKCPYTDIYTKAGFKCFEICADDGRGTEALREYMKGKLCVFTGVSGAGKSSILNKLLKEDTMETGALSKKLSRGKHTTRYTEIFYSAQDNFYIADTPGFSQLETTAYAKIYKEELAELFPEFEEYMYSCRFQDCSHTKEKECAVIDAVNSGEISKERHNSYVALYEEAKLLKKWEK